MTIRIQQAYEYSKDSKERTGYPVLFYDNGALWQIGSYMKKRFSRVIILIILGALIVVLPMEIIGLIKNQNAFRDEAEDKMEYAIKSASTDLDVVFNSMESLINMLQSVVTVTFSGKNYREDYDVFEQLKEQTGDIIRPALENTRQLSGMYLTFSPELHSGQEEVWYAYRNGRVEFIDARLYAPSWLKEGNPRVSFFYDAIKDGAYWDSPYYDSSLDKYMISYSRSVYDTDENLIGVVGIDMLLYEIEDTLESIKLYDDSQVVLLDSDMNYCASSGPFKHHSHIYSPVIERVNETGAKDGSPMWYTTADGEKYIAAYTTLNNGWILIATQPAGSVMTSAIKTRRTLIITMLLTITAIIIMVVIFIKKFYDPVIESAEQNEIMLINQSRQAKLGEMVGNIAHQCKQPLNRINIDISNMKDDYYADELTMERFAEYEKKMRENVSLMTDTITDFADFLKPDRAKERFSIRDGVDKALSIMKEKLVINEIIVIDEVDEDIYITSYRNEFTQCVFNILENARDAAVLSGRRPRTIRISTETEVSDECRTVRLNIFNSGDNIPEENIDKIFTAYFSTKESGGGTGIGLYLVRQIVENHFGGSVYCRNTENGVVFTIEMKEKDNG